MHSSFWRSWGSLVGHSGCGTHTRTAVVLIRMQSVLFVLWQIRGIFWLFPTMKQRTAIQPEKNKFIPKFRIHNQQVECQWNSSGTCAPQMQKSSNEFNGLPEEGSCRTYQYLGKVICQLDLGRILYCQLGVSGERIRRQSRWISSTSFRMQPTNIYFPLSFTISSTSSSYRLHPAAFVTITVPIFFLDVSGSFSPSFLEEKWDNVPLT